MKRTEAGAKKLFEAFQETTYFHLKSINKLFDDCECTLIVRSVKEDKVVCVYSEEEEDALLKVLDLAKETVKANSGKTEKRPEADANGNKNG